MCELVICNDAGKKTLFTDAAKKTLLLGRKNVQSINTVTVAKYDSCYKGKSFINFRVAFYANSCVLKV